MIAEALDTSESFAFSTAGTTETRFGWMRDMVSDVSASELCSNYPRVVHATV